MEAASPLISTGSPVREFETIVDLQNVYREFRIGGTVVRALQGVSLRFQDPQASVTEHGWLVLKGDFSAD